VTGQPQQSEGFTPNRVVLWDDPYNDPDEGTVLEFRLTYEGPLLAATGTNTRIENKHTIRKALHPQLKKLWAIVPHLDFPQRAIAPTGIHVNGPPPPPPPRSAQLAAKYPLNGFNFVPLVTEELSLICGVEILFLRPDYPGAVISSGDIDNRLKTLFDALRIPQVGQLKPTEAPDGDEKPFYVLLEDDKLISRLSVETDTLLQPIIGSQSDKSDARLIITVKLRPAHLSWENVAFG
jgi:hypothetical protein